MSKAKGPCVVLGATGYLGAHVVAACLRAGFPVRAASRSAASPAAAWLEKLGGDGAPAVDRRALDLAGAEAEAELDRLLEGAEAVFLAAGTEKKELATVAFMVDAAVGVLRAARRVGCPTVVITSSGGSTNPPGHANATPKQEHKHYSNPGEQMGRGAYSPAAKTLMDMAALAEVGRNPANEVVAPAKAAGAPRLVIINPNWINGPQLQPGDPCGNSLPMCAKMMNGNFLWMKEKIPNDSMSHVDVRDLADMHVAAVTNADASGRYFGVDRSYPWVEIFAALQAAVPGLKIPPRGFEGEPAIPTQFDFARRDSLLPGTKLRPMSETMADVAAQLKAIGALPK